MRFFALSLRIIHISSLFFPSGALLSFRQSSLNFTLSLSILDAFIRREKAHWMPETLGISLVRVDKDDFHPLYQVLSPSPPDPNHFLPFPDLFSFRCSPPVPITLTSPSTAPPSGPPSAKCNNVASTVFFLPSFLPLPSLFSPSAHLPPSVHYLPSDGTNFFDLRVQCSLQLGLLRLATLLKGLLVVFLLCFAFTLAFRAQYRRSPR